MKLYAHHPRGLNPTLRHQLIFVVFCTTVIAAHIGLYREGAVGNRPERVFSNIMLYFLLWMPPWLSVLLLIFDERGPVRQWYLACVMLAWAALVASFPLATSASYAWCGRPTPAYRTTIFVSLLLLAVMPHQIHFLLPGRCTRCDRRCAIPVLTIGQVGFPTFLPDPQEGWCAACGAEYRREGGAAWTAQPSAGRTGIDRTS